MLHSLEHVRDHQNPLAGTPTLVSCQAPQLGRPRVAAENVCRHRPSPKHGTLAYQLYHIWGSPETGITRFDALLLLARKGDWEDGGGPDRRDPVSIELLELAVSGEQQIRLAPSTEPPHELRAEDFCGRHAE